MAFYTSITAYIANKAEKKTNADGIEIVEVQALNKSCDPPILMRIQADADSEHGKFINALSQDAATKSPRVLVTGIVQVVSAVKNDETKEITKPPKLIVYAGTARRVRNDMKIEPPQAIIFGNGYARVQESRESNKRKPELYVSGSTESLVEEGAYSEGLQLLGDSSTKTDVVCLEIDDSREVYFMANLFRSAGEYMDVKYDKLKARATFLQETDRVRSKGGGKKGKTVSMSSQMSDSFETAESTAEVMTADELCKQAAVSLADF